MSDINTYFSFVTEASCNLFYLFPVYSAVNQIDKLVGVYDLYRIKSYSYGKCLSLQSDVRNLFGWEKTWCGYECVKL